MIGSARCWSSQRCSFLCKFTGDQIIISPTIYPNHNNISKSQKEEVKTVLKCASQSTLESKKRQKYKKSERQTLSHYAPFEEMLPSSYCLIKITSTKSRGAMMPIAAEGVTVRQIEMSCTRVDDKGTNSIKLNKKQIWYTFWYQFIQKVFAVLCLSQCLSCLSWFNLIPKWIKVFFTPNLHTQHPIMTKSKSLLEIIANLLNPAPSEHLPVFLCSSIPLSHTSYQ